MITIKASKNIFLNLVCLLCPAYYLLFIYLIFFKGICCCQFLGKTGRPALRSGRPALPGRMIFFFLSCCRPTAMVDRSVLQSSLEISADPCGRPLLTAELSGFLGRPSRSTVDRESAPKLSYLKPFLSLSLSLTFSADPLSPHSQKFDFSLPTQIHS